MFTHKYSSSFYGQKLLSSTRGKTQTAAHRVAADVGPSSLYLTILDCNSIGPYDTVVVAI